MVKKLTDPPFEEMEEIVEALEEEPSEELPVGEELIDGLTAEERYEIEAEAKALVEKEVKDRAKQNYKVKALAEARRLENIDPNAEIVVVNINLPGHAECITVNGSRYYHGGTYKVPRDLASFLMEKQQRCWIHEDEIGGANREMLKERNIKIGRKDLNTPSAHILHG